MFVVSLVKTNKPCPL